MLNLGGMENSNPKTTQNPNRFRVARNVRPRLDGVITPRNSFTTPSGQPSNIKQYQHLKDYGTDLFKMALSSSNIYNYYLNNTLLPRSATQGGTVSGSNETTSSTVMSYRKNNTLYVLNSSPISFFKYDGVEITGCGTPQPIVGCTSYTSVPASVTEWIKLYQYRIDFDQNIPTSELISFPVNSTPGAGLIAIRVDSAAPNIITRTPRYEIYPTSIISANSATSTDLFFITNTQVYNAGTNDITIGAFEHNITSASVGCYIFIAEGAVLSLSNVAWSVIGSVGYSSPITFVALRIKSVSGANIVLDCTGSKVFDTTLGWVNFNVSGASIVAAGITCGFRKVISVFQSTSKDGNYIRNRDIPAFPESTTYGTINMTIDLLSPTGDINLGDIYSTTSKKLSLNTNYDFGGTTGFLGMTAYQDQLVWWNDDLIYFSDPTLGGSVEHPSASSFIRVGDAEFGKVISCCGTADYLIVSRERKNYYINGNLATGNYRIQDITDIEIGAWCNNGMINIKDSVIMINAVGVWQIQSGGRVTQLSKQIPRNFSLFQQTSDSPDVAFYLLGTTTLPIVGGVDQGLDIVFDEYSELLYFCQRASDGTPVLVFHTKTGEFYEWTGLSGTVNAIRSMECIGGELYFGDKNGTSSVVKKESKSSFFTQDYAATYPIKLYTTWLTAGEPSLEKQLLQLKMFGYINTSGTRFNVVHYKDWNESTKITNASYVPDSSTQYSHIKRLNSDKVLAASVGIEINQSTAWFELESIEVEFNPIQQGMKR